MQLLYDNNDPAFLKPAEEALKGIQSLKEQFGEIDRQDDAWPHIPWVVDETSTSVSSWGESKAERLLSLSPKTYTPPPSGNHIYPPSWSACGRYPDGEGWLMNDPGTRHFYRSCIPEPDTGRLIVAPYIRYFHHKHHSEVALTYGDGYPVTCRVLQPIPVKYTPPPITTQELELLDTLPPFNEAVKGIVENYFPIELAKTFEYYRHFKTRQYQVQKMIKRLQDQEYRYLEQALERLNELERANFLGRLMGYEDELVLVLEDSPSSLSALARLTANFAGIVTNSATDATPNRLRNPLHWKEQDRIAIAIQNEDDGYEHLRTPSGRKSTRRRSHKSPKNPVPSKSRRLRCYRCSRRGHLRSNCPFGLRK